MLIYLIIGLIALFAVLLWAQARRDKAWRRGMQENQMQDVPSAQMVFSSESVGNQPPVVVDKMDDLIEQMAQSVALELSQQTPFVLIQETLPFDLIEQPSPTPSTDEAWHLPIDMDTAPVFSVPDLPVIDENDPLLRHIRNRVPEEIQEVAFQQNALLEKTNGAEDQEQQEKVDEAEAVNRQVQQLETVLPDDPHFVRVRNRETSRLQPLETILPNDPILMRVRQRRSLADQKLKTQQQNFKPMPDPFMETIGFDDPEANRMRQRLLQPNPKLEIIDENDPALNSVRNRIKNTAAHHSEEKPVVCRFDLETISFDEIQNHLARQRERQFQDNQDMVRHFPTVIPEDEVFRNLRHTDSPAPSRRRSGAKTNRQARQSATSTSGRGRTQQAISTRFVPFDSAVNIHAPVAVPTHELNQPNIQVREFKSSVPVQSTVSADTPRTAHRVRETATSGETEADTIKPKNATVADYPENNDFSEQDFDQYYRDWGAESFSSDEENMPLPPVGLLALPQHNPAAVQSDEVLIENGIVIEEKLAEFRVKVKVIDAHSGPVITRYEIEPDVGVRGNAVINLEKDLARSLGVVSIRVVETIPGKTYMGLELPNPKRQVIRLSEIFNSPAFEHSPSKLTLALGQDISGSPVVTDLAKAPHLLVAGTTGSGKSVGVNAMILSILFKARPQDVRLIMIDPKMLELSIYEGIPHLLAPVVTDMRLAAHALNWCVGEMEKRYRLMSHLGVRNIGGYNQKIVQAKQSGQNLANPFSLNPDDPEPLEKLPFIVVVVDEFADLMMVAGKKVEELIARLAQKARAAGIHLILATQRPSVDVITGLIKANIPTRIAFQVSSKIDSRTILDQMGAENLLGQGDMLFLPPGTGYPQRVHGAFVADEEVHRVVEYLKQFGAPEYIEEIFNATAGEEAFTLTGDSGDALLDSAVEFVMKTQKVTISSIQRHLKIGYNRAATLVEQMEEQGMVSAPDHTGKRTILLQNRPME